jgi:hypothetical protein
MEEEMSFQTLVKMVEVQNFVRTEKITKLDNYINICDNFLEYLVLIALLETDCIGLVQVLEMLCKLSLTCKNTGVKPDSFIIQKVFELLCKSRKRRSLWKILVKYYFEDSSFLSRDFSKIKNKSRNSKDLVVINIFKTACELLSHNECLVVALLCYLYIYLDSVHEYPICANPSLYVSARKPIVIRPDTYKNTNEQLIAETCAFWMNLTNQQMKVKMIKNYGDVIQKLKPDLQCMNQEKVLV